MRKRRSKQALRRRAVISPLLANVYLHYVFDLWVEVWRRKVASGELVVVRLQTIWWLASSIVRTQSGS